MKKTSPLKTDIFQSIIGVLALLLAGCMPLVNGGYGNMGNQMGVASMGGTSYIGGGQPTPGSGGFNGVNATKFAQNVMLLKVGVTTREEAIALLGSPALKSTSSGSEIWQYPLYTGFMPGYSAIVFNTNGMLSAVKVIKLSSVGGGINSEEVYSKGNFPRM